MVKETRSKGKAGLTNSTILGASENFSDLGQRSPLD